MWKNHSGKEKSYFDSLVEGQQSLSALQRERKPSHMIRFCGEEWRVRGVRLSCPQPKRVKSHNQFKAVSKQSGDLPHLAEVGVTDWAEPQA